MPDATTEYGVPAADGLYPRVDEQTYHEDRGSLSVSAAKLLLPPSCPEKFRWHQDHPRPHKKVWDVGHVAHALVLGKGPEIAILDPAVHGLKKDGSVSDAPAQTANWKDAVVEARRRGATPIHIDEYNNARAMADRVLSDPEAGPIFADPGGRPEVSMYATDPATGVRLRGRTDWLCDGEIDDLKTSTTANPAELQRKFWQLGYFMQAAWYIDLAAAIGLGDLDFRFVVVEKEPPHVVTVVRYDAESIAEGRRLNRQAIDLYARCRDNNEWPGYATGTVPLSLPNWVFRNADIQDRAEAEAAAAALIAELEGITA